MKVFYVLSNLFNIIIIKFSTLSAFGNYASFSLLVFLILPTIYVLFFLKSEFKRRDYEKLNTKNHIDEFGNKNNT